MPPTRLKLMGGVDFKIPNVSYCKDVKDVHYNPYNTVEFYVGEITGTTPQTVKIYTDSNTSVDVQVSKGNKWYTYLLPKDKGLYKIESGEYDYDNEYWYNGIVTKAVVKANVTTNGNSIIPYSTVEASFKGSDTSNVTSMASMFNSCKSLPSLDLSNFNTSNVTSMASMFSGCNRLTSLTLSNFNTSKVTNMSDMFGNCMGLTSLDLSNFNTSNVTNMYGMFSYCSNLTSLDVSNFDTSNVTNMNSMFSGCNRLTSLDVSNFNTSKVTNMTGMFYSCRGLTSLTLSGWDMRSVIRNTNNMFSGCNALKTIRMVGCSEATINKIKAVKPSSATIVTE